MMRFIYLILFTFSFSGFSQRTLEATFEQNEDGGAISKKGNPLIEYFIKDKDEKVIGSLILKNDESEFLYYNNRKEIVATELNKYTKEYFTPFELKDNISFISIKLFSTMSSFAKKPFADKMTYRQINYLAK